VRVGATEIEQIRIAKQVFQSWSLSYGGGVARDAVMGQLRWAAGLLKATCPDELRPELFSAVGDLTDTAGYRAMDAGADEPGETLFCGLQLREPYLPPGGRAVGRPIILIVLQCSHGTPAERAERTAIEIDSVIEDRELGPIPGSLLLSYAPGGNLGHLRASSWPELSVPRRSQHSNRDVWGIRVK